MEELNIRYKLCDQVVVEGFDDGALVLRLGDRHLIDLNSTAHHILVQTDGERTVAQVAATLVEAYAISEAEALEDTLALYAVLLAQGVVELADPGRVERKSLL